MAKKAIKVCLVAYEGENGVYRPVQVGGFGLSHALELKPDTPDAEAKTAAWLEAGGPRIAALREP